MANVNINRSVTDQFYRYKMPRIIAKVEGKGNGIKTVIVNMTDVAKSLQRPPTYPTKYFGCELGAQTQFDQKNDRYIVNGAHDAAKLQDMLDGFIKRFVLCPECDNPETSLNVLEKKGMIRQRCIACGHQGNVDMRHKLTTFIIKNPPGSEVESSSTPSKKDKKGKKGKNQVNGDASPEANGNGDGEDGEVTPPEEEDDGFGDDDDWGEDASEDAMSKRMEELTDAAKALAFSDDLSKPLQDRLNILYEYIKKRKEDGSINHKTADKEILAEADRLDVKEKAPLILVELLLDENILAQIKAYRNHFLRFTHENLKAQRYLVGGLEQLIGNVHREQLMPKVPHILKLFYDSDILDEEIILEWGKKVSKKYVSKEISQEIHTCADPFLKWLAEAEEESEESSDEDVEVVYSHTEKVGTHIIPKPSSESNKVEGGTEQTANQQPDEDFDIDAI